MTSKEVQEQIDLEEEYTQILQNQAIYYDKINLWNKSKKISDVLFVVFLIPTIGLFFELVDVFSEPEILTYYSTLYLFVFGFCPFLFLAFTNWVISRKVSEIDSELGLNDKELLYLHAYDTYINVDSCLKESNVTRKHYFRKLALKNLEEVLESVNAWSYGNIHLVKNLVGDQIDLLKNNLERLILSNVAEGKEKALTEISKIILKFCRYILSPSIEKLSELNNMIEKLPYVKYEEKTRRQRLEDYFHGRPRFCRILFASSASTIIAVVLLCLDQNIGLILAVAVTCFWGAFTGFDKVFRIKEK